MTLSSFRPMRRLRNLVRAGFRVEAPVGVLANERDWQGPLVLADDQSRFVVAVALEFMFFVIGSDE